MGHHYVSQEHLRRFSIKDKNHCVWMYDKETREFRVAAIKKVAQQSGYYDLEIEKALSKMVESPGKIAIHKLLNQEMIDNAERTTLSIYFLSMLTRGPRQRKQSREKVPCILEKLIAKAEASIAQGRGDHNSLCLLNDLKREQEQISSEFPPYILDIIRKPVIFDQAVDCLFRMSWHVIPVTSGMHFVTCDTPAHTFESLGLRSLESEYTISLSKDFALIGENKRGTGIDFCKSSPQLTKEINRRILSHAERFVFSPSRNDWIDKVAQKNSQNLNRIDWEK